MNRRFRSALALCAAIAASVALPAQAEEFALPRPSPLAKLSATVGVTEVGVAYSAPAAKGRKLFPDVVPFGKVWRAGANEATKLTFSRDAIIDGKAVPAGSYGVYFVPTAAAWTFILSKDSALWGSDGYSEAHDLLRATAATSAIPHRERLAYEILDATDDGATLALEWGTLRVAVPFKVDTKAHVLKMLPELKSDDWHIYFRAARYLADNKLETEKGLALAEKSIELKEQWENVWAKAELLAQKGDTKGALVAAKRARELGEKAEGYFPEAAIEKAIAEWK